MTIKIDNHYEKFVISGIIDKQEAQLFSTLPTEINQMMAISSQIVVSVSIMNKYTLSECYCKKWNHGANGRRTR
ncbi:MAG: hypothetical protein ACLVJN_10735 [Streptococcus parasanguinis]